MTRTAPSPAGTSAAGSASTVTTASVVTPTPAATVTATAVTAEGRIGMIRARAGHPQGYRLYDYRPDVLMLAACVETVLALHHPEAGHGPPADGGVAPVPCCRLCLRAWPCPTVTAITGSLAQD